MDGKTWIDTEYGKIHINDIPLVETESDRDKLLKCIIFFAFVIVVIILVLYLASRAQPKEGFLSDSESSESDYSDLLMRDVTGSMRATSVKLFNLHKRLPLKNVVIITTDGNVINYNMWDKRSDPKSKYNVRDYMYGDTQVYLVNFRGELDIHMIYLISHADQYIEHINVDLLYGDVPVWHYSGKLNPEQFNKIAVTNYQVNPSIRQSVPVFQPLEITDLPEKKLVINEGSLAIQISERDERYVM
jgi:hypothetical protein